MIKIENGKVIYTDKSFENKDKIIEIKENIKNIAQENNSFMQAENTQRYTVNLENAEEDKFRNLTVEKFSKILASKTPYPGGGGVAALLAAQGFALISMVYNFTTGKKKFEPFEEELLKIEANALFNMDRNLDLVQLDGINFEPLSKAYSLPSDTEEEKYLKAVEMQECSINACLVPMEIARISYDALDTLIRLKDISSVLVLSDVGVAAECFVSAIRSSMLNIYINLKNMEDSEEKSAIQSFVDNIEQDYLQKYNEVYNFVKEKIM